MEAMLVVRDVVLVALVVVVVVVDVFVGGGNDIDDGCLLISSSSGLSWEVLNLESSTCNRRGSSMLTLSKKAMGSEDVRSTIWIVGVAKPIGVGY